MVWSEDHIVCGGQSFDAHPQYCEFAVFLGPNHRFVVYVGCLEVVLHKKW